MSAEVHADDGAARAWGAVEPLRAVDPLDRGHPNVSGDLPTMLQAAPMFRRAVAGYDRFQVDTYVRWAEDELATADREREHLVARHLRTRAALDEARELLAHSSGGGEFLQLNRRLGSMLAAAADDAESMRAEGEATLCAATARAEQMVARAERVLTDAEAEAERSVAEAATEAEHLVSRAATEAGRIVDEAEQTGREARLEAEARLEKVRTIEERAAADLRLMRQQAEQDVAAARLQARDEIVRMLGTGREQRRRADAAAAATRERLDRDAAARRTAVLADIKALERRRSSLRAKVAQLAAQTAVAPDGRLDLHLQQVAEWLRWRPWFLRAP
jgi:hypothetical protein